MSNNLAIELPIAEPTLLPAFEGHRWRVAASSLLSILRYSRVIFGRRIALCPLCGYVGRFHVAGMPPRLDARCPHCNSLERHRLLALYFQRHPIVTQRDVLHFAPEKCISSLVSHLVPKLYVRGDLHPAAGDVKLNIEKLDYTDCSFDLVLCSHVLEHVDDGLALAEIHRVLRPDGTALLMIPVIEGWEQTYENPQIVSESERELHFGQNDHLRYYGRDVRKRIEMAGFQLQEFAATPSEIIKYSLQRGEIIFIAQKPA